MDTLPFTDCLMFLVARSYSFCFLMQKESAAFDPGDLSYAEKRCLFDHPASTSTRRSGPLVLTAARWACQELTFFLPLFP